jgi:hypothetical protein
MQMPQYSIPRRKETEMWEEPINDLVSCYRDVERRCLSLPAFSLAPVGIAMWNTIKFEVCVLLDIFLLVPMNLVILLRNFFPGRWSYRSFSWRYIKYVALWIGRGEVPQVPFVVIRWLITAFLHTHFRSRLRLLRRRIILEDSLSQEERTLALSRVDQLLEAWRGPRVLSATFTYGLPAAGFLLEIYRSFRPSQLPPWTGAAAYLLISYGVTFVVSSFMVKRGLMLGGVGRSTYFPGSLEGRGAFGEEARIFDSIGVSSREFPLDMVLALVGIPLTFLGSTVWMNLYESWGIATPSTERQLIIQQLYYWVPFVLLGVLALYRRMKLRRV